MNYTQEFLRKLQHVKRTIGGYKTNKVCVEIDGRIHYLDEYDIRAMQVMVMQMNDEEYQKFCNRVTIYSGRYKRLSDHKMLIKKNGNFAQRFESGFYDVSDTLAMYMFKHTPILTSK